MENHDDKIKELFRTFEPELSASSADFMHRLQKNMEAVEIVRQYGLTMRKRNRIAVTIAAFCGFAAGVIMTLLLPLVNTWVATFSISIPHLHIWSLTIDCNYLAWFIMAITCVIIALNAYDVALARLSASPSRKPEL